MDPYSTAEVSLRPHERERPPFHAGPDRGSSIRPTRDVISGDNKSENHRGFLVGQRDSAYGDGMSNNRQMDFSPPASTRGFDNRGPPALERSIDRRPPVMPPARQSYDDHTRKEVVPFSGARHAEPPYGAFQHDTPRNASRQEDFRQVLIVRSILAVYFAKTHAPPPLSTEMHLNPLTGCAAKITEVYLLR
ncbi:hypothetical protein QFC19_000653 [Naganishia cerealis]|uniref:Uncharacterized protein n=1 Tax=Naganishia cerealis TaxID=610337 RepID=A0ACC2WMF3_9TREE|nr:hypothetical protein QFC19_000653 [Naganishia cerealis]